MVKRFTYMKMYKCKECGWRGYRSTAMFTVKSLQVLLIYLGIAIVIALLVRTILSRVVS